METHCRDQCSLEFNRVSQLEKNKLEKSKSNHQQQQPEESEEREGVGSTSTVGTNQPGKHRMDVVCGAGSRWELVPI